MAFLGTITEDELRKLRSIVRNKKRDVAKVSKAERELVRNINLKKYCLYLTREILHSRLTVSVRSTYPCQNSMFLQVK